MSTFSEAAANPAQRHAPIDGLETGPLRVPPGTPMPRPAQELLKTVAQRKAFCDFLRAGARSWTDAEEVCAGFLYSFAHPATQPLWVQRLCTGDVPDALIDGIVRFRSARDSVAGGFIFMSAIRMLGFLASQTSVDPALKRTLIRRADEMLGGIVAGRAAFERAVSVRDAVTAFVRDLVDLLPSANADAGLADRHPYLAELLIFLYAMPCDNFDASTLSNAQYFEMLLCHTFAVAGMFTIDGAGDARRIRLQQIVIRNNLVDAIGTNLNFRLSASSQLGDQAALTALALFSTLVVKTVVEPERLLADRKSVV